jgi:histidyl-tRNA synthetase
MNIPIPTGTFDILPHDSKEVWRNSFLWTYVESKVRKLAESYGFEEIRTPLFERTELFQRSVGDASDIVSKEMYTFEDKGGRSLSLRPEGTASVIRAFVEKKLYTESNFHRLFYIGPMFRYERPQSGRFRQHHQFGVEVIGSQGAELDAELIEMCYSLYQSLGLQNLTVYVNSLGDKETRGRFREALRDYLRPYLHLLSPESQTRFELNPLRIFDSKNEADKEVMKNAPTILEYLSLECREHFETVCRILEHLNVPFKVNTNLVRGLDYYTKTVFEITAGELGAQNTIGAGGRYDGLIKDLGGPDLPSIGFATGLERVIQALIRQEAPLPQRKRPQLYAIPLGQQASFACFSLVKELRSKGFIALQDMSGKKLKNAMQIANDARAEYTLVLGDREIEEGICEIKEMDTGHVKKLPIAEVGLFFTTRYTKE